jgi:hypothetical protein
LDEETELKKISTDEQRQEIIDEANNVEEWLYDEGFLYVVIYCFII